MILQHAISNLEDDQRPGGFRYNRASFRPNRKTVQTLHTRLGTIRYRRWYFQTSNAWYRGLAPLDGRLGIVDVRRGFNTGRLSPALAEVIGRLAAEMPQQAAIQQIAERFDVKLSVEAYRRCVDHIHRLTQAHSDEQAIEQLIEWTAYFFIWCHPPLTFGGAGVGLGASPATGDSYAASSTI